MKKLTILKIFVALLISITVLMTFSQNVFAKQPQISNLFEGTSDKSAATDKVSDLFGSVINFIQVIATGFAILMLIWLGIQWMYASPSGKAQVAKSSRYYILGAILIFAAVGLLQIVKNFTDKSIVGQI